MKIKTVVISTVLFVLIFVALISYGDQKAKWKGKIEIENGVKVIKNPKDPLYGEIELELEEDLSIGREDDENYLFYRVRGVALDSEENIYVLDKGNFRIQKFDKNGECLQTIGRKGQGPGEFQAALGFFIDAEDNIYLNDFRQIDRFNKQGQFIDSIPLNIYINDITANPKGNILANGWVREKGGIKRMIIMINSDGKIIKKIAEISDYGPKIIITDTATWTLAPNRNYNPLLFSAALGEKDFVYGHSSEYQLFKIDENGEIILTIKKEETLLVITRGEKNFIIERDLKNATKSGMKISKKIVEEACHFHKYRPFYNKFIIDSKKRLYVQRVRSVLDESELINFDIFSNEGYYLYKTSLSFSPEVIKNGFVYDVLTSGETGEVKIKRYKIKNWREMKEGV
jgi:hypothetical protein